MAKRGTTIPVAAWWFEAVRREMGAMTLPELSEKTGGSDQSALSRCLNGSVTTLHLVVKISDALKIARPVFLPQTEQEALAIHGALGLRAVDARIAAMHAEIDDEERDLRAKRKPPKT